MTEHCSSRCDQEGLFFPVSEFPCRLQGKGDHGDGRCLGAEPASAQMNLVKAPVEKLCHLFLTKSSLRPDQKRNRTQIRNPGPLGKNVGHTALRPGMGKENRPGKQFRQMA